MKAPEDVTPSQLNQRSLIVLGIDSTDGNPEMIYIVQIVQVAKTYKTFTVKNIFHWITPITCTTVTTVILQYAVV